MGLTKAALGCGAIDSGLTIERATDERVIALAGNPNVGKSTLFNALTGMNQHTGNWAGKTVANAQGRCATEKRRYVLVDIPGTYSLRAHSAQEEVARDFICFNAPDAVVVVCDATCLERNLNLVLQIIEVGVPVAVCVNLMDEAKRKHITININALERQLGVPVVTTVARKKSTIRHLLDRLDELDDHAPPFPTVTTYPAPIEDAVRALTPTLESCVGGTLNTRWVALRLLEQDSALLTVIQKFVRCDLTADPEICAVLAKQRVNLSKSGLYGERLRDTLVSTLVLRAQAICKGCVLCNNPAYADCDRRADRVLTSRLFGYPVMVLLLMSVFWLTIKGANIPSQLLADALFWLQDCLSELFRMLRAPTWLHDMLVLGVYRTLAWVISVMLPPMAIFFPLFTLLEDVGYLPRIAYNLDRPFNRCHACGKQALTMCMGFGCNAAGVVGCRIIDSPRERLLAILTNNFVPCNGRFPTLLTLLTIFFIGTTGNSSLIAAVLLTAVILLGVLITFVVTRLLSKTLLRGKVSAFTLELPPYRRPQIGQVILRSMLDRTLFVLGRAAAVAAPAGLILWCLANITVADATLLIHCAEFLDPAAQIIGLDGVILLAFILGFPANEIVIPIMLMAYLAKGSLTDIGNLSQLRDILIMNGWTPLTAACTVLFSLFHWPCSTTLLTIRKESGSIKWTLLAAALPTVIGILLCTLLTAVSRLL